MGTFFAFFRATFVVLKVLGDFLTGDLPKRI